MRENRTLGLTRRGLETSYGSASEALPKGNREQQIGRAYELLAPALDPTDERGRETTGCP